MRRDSLPSHLSGPRCQWQSRGRLPALSPSISSFLSFVTVTIIADSAAPPTTGEQALGLPLSPSSAIRPPVESNSLSVVRSI